MKRVSEIVTIDEINSWNDGDIITITAGTGAGKSYFIKNNLYAIAKRDNKKILMLVHRINCLDQFQYEIQSDNKTDIITLGTYQSIQHSSLRGVKSNKVHPSDFDYVICDEFHYFMSDANFNKTTDLSLNEILEAKNSIRVFMSATGDYVERYLKYKGHNIKPYRLSINFDFIKSLTFYIKEETLESYIKQAIKENHKIIVFINNVKLASELYQKYQEYSLFNCSENNDEYELVNKDKIDKMLKNERFDDLILFTTTVMDTGVNIYDSEIKNIICHNILDVRVLTQCIGRIRFENKKVRNKGIHLTINSFTNRQLNGYKTSFSRQIEHANYLLKHGTSKYNKKFFRNNDKSNIIYDDRTEKTSDTNEVIKKVNELAYYKRKIDINEIDLMLKKGKCGYCNYLKDWFEFNGKYTIQEEQNHIEKLESYLDSIAGKRLLKEEQENLINKINLQDARGRIQRGIKTINGYFEDNQMNYKLVSKRTSKRIKGKVKSIRYWELINDIDH